MHLVFRILVYSVSFSIYGMGARFLMLPSSIEQLALGNHTTISSASPVNSSLFSTENKKSNLQLSRGVWIGDVNLMNISFNQAFKNKVFHFGVNYSGLTGFEFRENKPEDLPRSYFSSYGLFMKTGVSIKNIKNNVGVSLSFLKMGIETQETDGLAINFGYAYQFNQAFRFGVSLENFGFIDEFNTKKVNLPIRLISTISSKILPDKYNSIIYGSVDWALDNSYNKYLVGNSINWKNLKLYNGFLISEKLKEFSTGFSIRIKSIDIGYGKKFSSHNLGSPQMISFKIILP